MGCIQKGQIDKPQYITSKPQPFQLSCKICFMAFDNSANQPMVISCGHTICSACLRMLTKTACPYDRSPFQKDKAYKNMELLQLIDHRNEAKRNEQVNAADTPNLCPAKHQMKFMGTEELCSVCECSRGGWKCSTCSISICCECFKKKPTKFCFNGHPTVWRGVKLRCVKCHQLAYGWHCQECSYCFCTKCSETPKETAVCPNGHPTRWSSRKDIACVMCGLQESGQCCQGCRYNICKGCRPTKPLPMRCPNNHRTTWTRNTSGLSCFQCNSNSSRHGFACRECGYLVCTFQAGWNIKEKTCPSQHSRLIWRPLIDDCIIHCQPRDGFKCIDPDCQYSVCQKCLDIKPVAGVCYNQHTTVWKKYRSGPCIKCSSQQHGWDCTQDCGYSMCSRCTKTNISGVKCPNNHTKLWTRKEAQCLVCKQVKESGRACEECSLFSCDSCEKSDLTMSLCPNGHTLELAELDSQCLICKQIDKCWRCQRCSFDGCIRCIKRKLNRISCPNSHPVKLSHKPQAVLCIRCKRYSRDFYECLKQCLPICSSCLTP